MNTRTLLPAKKLAVTGSLIVTLLLASSCQDARTRPEVTSNKKTEAVDNHNGIFGVKTVYKTRRGICRRPVKISPRRYGHLSRKAKRRFLYDYVTGIRSSIRSRWQKPTGVAVGERCTVKIRQRIDGCVRQVSFRNCRHFKMRTTVRMAVLSASPLPQAPHPALFSDDIVLTFKLR